MKIETLKPDSLSPFLRRLLADRPMRREGSFVQRELSKRGIKNITGTLFEAMCRCNEEIYDRFLALGDSLQKQGIPDLLLGNTEIEALMGRLERGEIAEAVAAFCSAKRAPSLSPPIAPPIKAADVSLLPDGLVAFMTAEDDYLSSVASKNDATVDRLFHSLDHASARLGEMGLCVAVYRPVDSEGRWQLTHATSRYGESCFDKPCFPDSKTSAVGKIIADKPDNEIIVVDIDNQETFINQGLPYSVERARADREQTVGSGETLFIKLRSRYGVEAVIQIHNRRLRSALEKLGDGPLAGKSEKLLPDDPEAARQVLFLLRLYFTGQVVDAIEKIKGRGATATSRELSLEDKRSLLGRGEGWQVAGQRVRMFEVPNEKFRDMLDGVISWLRQTILAVYTGTSVAEGKTTSQLVTALSLEDGRMDDRLIGGARYTALIEGPKERPEDLLGVVSFTVLDVAVEDKHIPVLKVPEAMIRREARGKKLQVALTNEIGKRLLRKLFIDNGIIRGFWLLVTRGVPVYATTQSLRVVRDMSRLTNFSLLRVVSGKGLNLLQKAVIATGMGEKSSLVDDRGVERGAYAGPIAIAEEEVGIKIYGGERDIMIKELQRELLETNGRFHLIGNLTLWVGIKTSIELFISRIFAQRGEMS